MVMQALKNFFNACIISGKLKEYMDKLVYIPYLR